MTARILVVDDILANLKLLEARLTAEYFDVVTAISGLEAIDICERSQCDIVLLDVMMPGMDGFEVCRHLKSQPATAHIPVVMVTALDQPADRVKGLEAGADDFLTKPVNDLALLARVRSLTRLKMATDELRARASTTRDLGLGAPTAEFTAEPGIGGRILIVDDRPSSFERLKLALETEHTIEIEQGAQEALFRVADGNYDIVLVSLALKGFDGLRICSQIRSLERTRNTPILILADQEDEARILRGLDIGVNDYVMRPIDRNELMARVRTQIRRKRYADRLRDSVIQSVEFAVTDALTNLHNRRYFDSHAATMVDKASLRGKPMSLLILDIDHFKRINDEHGHDVGDDVLREFAVRIRKGLRGSDMPCRLGGEEFVVLMPDTDLSIALVVAERLRKRVHDKPFTVARGAKTVDVTVSIGAASNGLSGDTIETILKRADDALYTAKRSGRNKVVSEAA
ncbi:MAG: PleD family two-component system response regulator [Labrys sp. (in: a-proteobacteria)]